MKPKLGRKCRRCIIRGRDYTEWLEHGRGPGGLPPISAIETWVNAKLGLYGTEATSAAWGIAKTIQAEGNFVV